MKSFRKSYDTWFDNVRNTRHFTPGFIHIGSDYENPSHLSRYQDSAYYDGKPTGWPVYIEKSGKYEITINREPSTGTKKLCVKIDDILMSKTLKTGENRAIFQLPSGKFKLNIWIQEEGKSYEPRGEEDTIGDIDIRRL